MPKMVHFGEFFNTWSLRSNSVTRQVSFNRTKIGGKCQKLKNSDETFGVIFKQCAYPSGFIVGRIQRSVLRRMAAALATQGSLETRCLPWEYRSAKMIYLAKWMSISRPVGSLPCIFPTNLTNGRNAWLSPSSWPALSSWIERRSRIPRSSRPPIEEPRENRDTSAGAAIWSSSKSRKSSVWLWYFISGHRSLHELHCNPIIQLIMPPRVGTGCPNKF